LQGGTGAGVDTVHWRHGNFLEIVHRIDHDGSGRSNDRPKKGDLKDVHFDDTWPQVVPLIDEFPLDFSSLIAEKVDSQWLQLEDTAVIGIGHAVSGQQSARRETASADWVFRAMGDRSGGS
jgi:hypothetical protein